MRHRTRHMNIVAVRSAMAFGDMEPSEEYEEWVETGGWDLERIHPESCWYTIKATPAERLEHYREQLPPCEYFQCEGASWGGRWFDCVAPPGPWHEHIADDRQRW